MKPPRFPWRLIRRLVQLGCLAGFFYLYRRTELTMDEPGGYVSTIFMIDPLAALASMLAGRAFVLSMLWSLLVIALTLLFARAFCGWLCPLGVLIDWVGKPVRMVKRAGRAGYRAVVGRAKPDASSAPLGGGLSVGVGRANLEQLRVVRYGVLIAMLLAALFGLQLVGYLDPFAILVRGMTFAVDPALTALNDGPVYWLGEHGPGPVAAAGAWLSGFLDDHVLAFSSFAPVGAGVSAAILLSVFALEAVDRRFWCRYLCPLGAMLGVVGKYAVLGRKPIKTCNDCRQCATQCRMGAFDGDHKFDPQACTVCMDCVAQCPRQIVTFSLVPTRSSKSRWTSLPRVDLSRRGFVTAAATGVALPVLTKGVTALAGGDQPRVLRPPGAGDEARFLDLCIRCGQCMKVCPTHGLSPTMLQTGLAGMFAPMLVPRTGYCEYNCQLCGTVCPTGAIPNLPIETKQTAVVGLAAFDTSRCIPYARNEECIVCEEHCPVADKAIHTRPIEQADKDGVVRTLLQPYVIAEKCIGCGICEWCCPLEGPAGVRVHPRPSHSPL